MKNRDQKMRERYERLEEERLQRKIDKEIRKKKEAAYARSDKDEYEAEAIQRLLNLRAKLEG